MRSPRRIDPAVLLFPLFILGALAAAWIFRDRLFAVFSSPQRVRAAVEGAGGWGVALFVALQVLQVVVFVIPGEVVQIAGGWLFGVGFGSIYSIFGITIGSMLNFAAARLWGKRFVEALFGVRPLERFDGITRSSRSAVAFFLLFVIPGIPKDALCFVAGLSAMRPLSFLAVSMIGRLPGIVGSSLMGQAAFEGSYGLLIGVAAAAAALFAVGALFRDRIHDAVVAVVLRRKKPTDEPPRPPAGA